MFKKIILSLLVLVFTLNAYSQCAVESWSLEKRVSLSTSIVEGKVVEQHAFWDREKKSIYTSSVIEVYKVFKGNAVSTLEIITYGGQIGLERHQADPELNIAKDDLGIFLLFNNAVDLPDDILKNGRAKFQGVASIQSFISYDLDENLAFDHTRIFKGITTDLYETMQDLTRTPFKTMKSWGYNPERLKYKPVAGPVITGFGSSSANAGTGDILTINGQGFLNARGKGRIEFLDANYGDGRRFRTPYAADYSVWNDTQIKVRIPSNAGTGSIKVATNDSGTFTTLSSFKINFSQLNLGYKPTGGNEQYYAPDHINDNGKGGYTFQLNTKFKAKTGMVNAFLRSMETWRCGTFMNWDVGRDTTLNSTAADEVNLVRLVDFPDNKLAVCYSRWNGCYSGTGSNMEWFVVELDIEADSTIKWYFGTGNPTSSEYDFQSVLSHELGHGHQLGHVISTNEMMHYSISNGAKKSSLSTNDLNGGTYIKNKGANINVCSGNRLVPLNSNNCGYTSPIAGFVADKLIVCPNNSVIFTDTSKGLVKTYAWNFGSNATPVTATGKGPHNVTFSKDGLQKVSLKVSNDFGKDSSIKNNYINVLPAKPTAPVNLTYNDTACLGLNTLMVDTFKGIGTLTWVLPPQATEISGTINSKKVSWTAPGGPYTFYVNIVNQCGSGDSLKGIVRVLNNPTAQFTALENGRTVTFTNSSQFATSSKWYFGDGDSSTLANPVHTYPMGKVYTAELRSTNQCKTVLLSKAVNPFHPASVSTTPSEKDLVYPNPVSGWLNFNQHILKHELFDATGKLLSQGNERQIDMSAYSPGIFILKLELTTSSYRYIKVYKN